MTVTTELPVLLGLLKASGVIVHDKINTYTGDHLRLVILISILSCPVYVQVLLGSNTNDLGAAVQRDQTKQG